MLIQRSIYDKAVKLIAERFSQMRVGLPESNPDCGPIITKAQFGRVQKFIEECRARDLPVVAQVQTGRQPS
ncbi:hypothetical protein CU663_04160 [Pseudomonas syringae pv. actinidifoliorum]|nr:hypothetical protein [Pseudomonas syringae pv. actinidifoliorum]